MHDSSFRAEVNDAARDLGSTNAPKVARHVFDLRVKRAGYFVPGGASTFRDDDLGKWAYNGCYKLVKDALVKGDDGPVDYRQGDMFADMPGRAYVPEENRFAEVPEMVLAQWRSAIAFKRQKAMETLAEAQRMADFERAHLDIWEANPDWPAAKVAAHGKRRGSGEVG
jgi:hypothetical protein